MKLTAPSTITFLVSLAIFVFAVLPLAGVAVPNIGISTLWILIVAYAVLAAGVLLRRV